MRLRLRLDLLRQHDLEHAVLELRARLVGHDLAGQRDAPLEVEVARATKTTDLGGYLDILVDFVFYVAIPVGFGLADPENARFALLLVASFTLTGVSFLAFATIAAKRGLETAAHGKKSFFYSTGIAEGTETIAAFLLMCLAPAWFPAIATVYAILCLLTVAQRTVAAAALFRDGKD